MESRETDNTLVSTPEKPLAAAFADAVTATVDIVDAHHREDIMEPMQIPYLLAQCVLQLARDTEVFHVLGVYIARQGLRLVLLLNADIAEEGPGKQQLEERDKLRDDLIELEKSMSIWLSDLGTEDEYERRCQEIKRQYNRFFATRFYFPNSRHLSLEYTFERLITYDRRSIDFEKLHRPSQTVEALSTGASMTLHNSGYSNKNTGSHIETTPARSTAKYAFEISEDEDESVPGVEDESIPEDEDGSRLVQVSRAVYRLGMPKVPHGAAPPYLPPATLAQDESRLQSKSSNRASISRQGFPVSHSPLHRAQSMEQNNPSVYVPPSTTARLTSSTSSLPAYSIQDPSPTRSTNPFINQPPPLTLNIVVPNVPTQNPRRRTSAMPTVQSVASSNPHRSAPSSTVGPPPSNNRRTAQAPNGYRNQTILPPMNNQPGRALQNPTMATPANNASLNRRASAEDPLMQLFKYDTVIIVDDSSSMAGALWYEAKEALAEVAKLAAKYDADGIDICFLNSPETGKGISAADVNRLFERVEPHGITPTGEKLEELLLDYLLRLEQAKAEADAGHPAAMQQMKPVNFLVITDGAPTDDPETVIVTAARRLDQGRFPITQVGIQFIQIGNDPSATEALRELDDDLAGKYQIRDIVDTTPYTGNRLDAQMLTKISLGGINRRLDRRGPA